MKTFEYPNQNSEKKPSQESTNDNQEMSRRSFLKRAGLFGVGLAIGGVPGLLKNVEAGTLGTNRERKEKVELPAIFQDMAKNTGAGELLKKPEYVDIQNYKQIDALYQIFSEENLGQSTVLAIKFIEFIDRNEKDLETQFPPEKLERIYQQAGYVLRNALEKYFQQKLKSKEGISSELLVCFSEGFRKNSQYYTQSAKFDKAPLEENGELDKTFGGIIELNSTMTKIANRILISGENQDLKIAADLRELVGKNVGNFEKVDAKFIDLGSGKIIYPSIKDAATLVEGFAYYISPHEAKELVTSWKKHNAGGIQMYPGEIATYLNDCAKKGKEDLALANFMIANGAIKKSAKGYERNPEIPSIFLSDFKNFVHENQHNEFNENHELVIKTVKMWNETPQKIKAEFLEKTGAYIDINADQKRILMAGEVSPEKILASVKKQIEGIKLSKDEEGVEIAISEFFAYSTDNSKSWFLNQKYEIDSNF